MIVNGTNSTAKIGIYDTPNGKYHGTTFSFVGYISYQSLNTFHVLHSNGQAQSIKIKNFIFETTFLSDGDIRYKCNGDSSFCIGCNLINYESTPLGDITKFDSCNQICGPLCLDCNGKFQCLHCKPNIGIATIIDLTCHCADGYYFADSTQLCVPCHGLCLLCTGRLKSDCDLCKTGDGIAPQIETTCSCLNGYYFADATQLCVLCHELCKLCTGGLRTECNSCKTGIRIAPLFETTCDCIENYYYKDSIDLCQKCYNPLCRFCINGFQNGCIECLSLNKIGAVDNGNCECADGFYYIDEIRLCEPCHPLCIKCLSPNNNTCIECIYMEGVSENLNSVCDCVIGFFYASEVSSCIKCEPMCLQCISFINCIKCKEIGYVIFKGKCVLNCTYSNDILAYCIDCKSIKNCAKCSGTKCLQCSNSYILFENKCISVCPIGFYISNSSNPISCKPCHKSCLSCVSAMKFGCITCNQGYQRSDIYCIELICKLSEYKENGTCFSCHSKCISCIGPGIDSCLTCKIGLIEIKIKGTNIIQCKECSEIATGMYYKNDISSCDEICGDGINMGIYECDDGNTKNRDGCNSRCLIESAWECNGGSVESSDICVDNRPILFKSYLTNHSKILNIVFNKNISFLPAAVISNSIMIEAFASFLSKECKFSIDNITMPKIISYKKLKLIVNPGCTLNGSEVIFYLENSSEYKSLMYRRFLWSQNECYNSQYFI